MQWRPLFGRERGHLVRRLPPDAALEILELLRRQLVTPLELHRRRIEQQVHVRRGLEELAERILLLAGRFEKGVEVVVDRLDDLVEPLAVAPEAFFIVGGKTRQMRRDVRILDLVLRAGDDTHPWLTTLARIALDRRKQDHIVDADDVRLDLLQHSRQVLLRPFGGRHDHPPAILDVIVDLLIGRLGRNWRCAR